MNNYARTISSKPGHLGSLLSLLLTSPSMLWLSSALSLPWFLRSLGITAIPTQGHCMDSLRLLLHASVTDHHSLHRLLYSCKLLLLHSRWWMKLRNLCLHDLTSGLCLWVTLAYGFQNSLPLKSTCKSLVLFVESLLPLKNVLFWVINSNLFIYYPH